MKKYIDTGKKDTRSGFGAGLAELGRTNPNVVALCADLIGSLKMEKFIEKNSDIYDEKYKVYTEFEIYDSEGRKRIIDRINIDEENKKIYIYDYKTGFEPETNEKYQEQINEYRDILSKKVSTDYEIDVKLLEV